MSTSFGGMGRRHSDRMAAHRAMMDHLAIHPADEDVTSLFADLRKTVMGCAQCVCPQACGDWVAQGHAGAPPWCNAAQAFADLNNATDRLAKARANVIPLRPTARLRA